MQVPGDFLGRIHKDFTFFVLPPKKRPGGAYGKRAAAAMEKLPVTSPKKQTRKAPVRAGQGLFYVLF